MEVSDLDKARQNINVETENENENKDDTNKDKNSKVKVSDKVDKIIGLKSLINKENISTPIGRSRLLKVDENDELQKYYGIIVLQKFQLLRSFQEDINKEEKENFKTEKQRLYDMIKDFSFIEIIKNNIYGLLGFYTDLFNLCFRYDYEDFYRIKELNLMIGFDLLKKIKFQDIDKVNIKNLYDYTLQELEICYLFIHKQVIDILDKTPNNNSFDMIENDEDLELYVELICRVNKISLIKENPNPEIEWFNKIERAKQQSNVNITFENIYTSVWSYVGYEPKNITLYALNSLFQQISQIKSFDANVIFRSVGADIEIDSWCGNIDYKNKNEISEKEFMNRSKKVMN